MNEEKIEIHARDRSPVAEIREKHNIEMEDKKYENEWSSCCFKIDRRATRYFTQLAIA
jgi:hypothetical protein